MAGQDLQYPILDLGMLEDSPAWKLSSRFLVHSKVGGKPSWLHLSDLPEPESLECPNCTNPMVFLAQLYAPIETKASAFHRTLYVFMCKNPQCHLRTLTAPFVVFRSQLSRKNDFYPFDAPPEVAAWKPEIVAGNFSQICRICGCAGTKKCAGCKKVTYCSKDHQTSDWKTRHKSECKDSSFIRDVLKEDLETNDFTFPQWEIVMHGDDESDSEDSEAEDDNDDAKEKSEMKKFEELLSQGQAGSLPPGEIEKYATEEEEKKDRTFLKFTRVIKRAPKQVVRYSRGGNPLWVSENEMAKDVPNCEKCSEPRIFEFQLMPQLLNSLKLDNNLEEVSIDWGVLAVYTCRDSCDVSGPAYKKEFLFRQNFQA